MKYGGDEVFIVAPSSGESLSKTFIWRKFIHNIRRKDLCFEEFLNEDGRAGIVSDK